MHTKYYVLFFSLCTTFLLCATPIIIADEYITITSPTDGQTISSSTFFISGNSSQPNFKARLKIGTTTFGSVITDNDGNWSFFAQNFDNGSYTITAELISPRFEKYATANRSFTIHGPNTITITSPTEGEVIFSNIAAAYGASSLPNTPIEFLFNDSLITATTTDGLGNWQANYMPTTNGAHTLTVNLIENGQPIATATTTIICYIPVLFPVGTTQASVVGGVIPTVGSGSGPGYTYSVSGNMVTLNFSQAFSHAPSIIAVGQIASGTATVSITSVSLTSASLTFSNGTESIHFVASAFT